MRKTTDKVQKNIKNLPNKKTFYVFLFCLSLSICLWAISKFSKIYIHELIFEVKYTNLPIDKVFFKEAKDKIFIRVKSNGFQLLKNKFFKKFIFINLSEVLKNKEGKYFWTPNEYFGEISNQLRNIEIIEIKSKSSSISLSLSDLAFKEVPIKLDFHHKYRKGFKEKKILLKPNTLKISGPFEKIQNINYIKTSFWKLEKINSNTIAQLDLLLPKKIKAYEKKVWAHLSVEPYSEKVIIVPIKIINLPPKWNYMNVKLSLEKVRLTFKVGYEDYKKVKNYDFLVVCDLSKFDQGFNQIPLYIKSYPSFINKKDIYLYPDKVRVFVLEN